MPAFGAASFDRRGRCRKPPQGRLACRCIVGGMTIRPSLARSEFTRSIGNWGADLFERLCRVSRRGIEVSGKSIEVTRCSRHHPFNALQHVVLRPGEHHAGEINLHCRLQKRKRWTVVPVPTCEQQIGQMRV
jgi:hypothetical protein